jgi:hypothetical protein
MPTPDQVQWMANAFGFGANQSSSSATDAATPGDSATASGTVTIPEVTVVGDPADGRAYQVGFSDGQARLPGNPTYSKVVPINFQPMTKDITTARMPRHRNLNCLKRLMTPSSLAMQKRPTRTEPNSSREKNGSGPFENTLVSTSSLTAMRKNTKRIPPSPRRSCLWSDRVKSARIGWLS